MKLYYHKSPVNNFGDVLNPWFWNKIFGEQWQEKGPKNEIAVGIGTLINESLNSTNYYHILGSGVGYGKILPKNRDRWNIHCVRGPLSAKTLELEPSFAITDPAILISDYIQFKSNKKRFDFSFMPHVDIDSYKYQVICERVGINYISPRWDMYKILANINQSEKLLCSAMHGAILADTLRVPWLPIITANDILSFKWNDWCQSVNLEYRAEQLIPLWPKSNDDLIRKLKDSVKMFLATQQLVKLKKSGGFLLSKTSVLEQKKEQLTCVFDKFKTEILQNN